MQYKAIVTIQSEQESWNRTQAFERYQFQWLWVIFSDLAKYSITLSIARSLCDSWASDLSRRMSRSSVNPIRCGPVGWRQRGARDHYLDDMSNVAEVVRRITTEMGLSRSTAAAGKLHWKPAFIAVQTSYALRCKIVWFLPHDCSLARLMHATQQEDPERNPTRRKADFDLMRRVMVRVIGLVELGLWLGGLGRG